MGTYTIKEGQTALDVVNQLYVNTDNIGSLYLENESFDVNKMQNTLEINYIDPQPSQPLSDIKNNGYTFINRDNVVYDLYTSIELPIGIYDLSDGYPGIIDGAYWELESTGEKGYIGTNTILRLFEPSTFNIYYEVY